MTTIEDRDKLRVDVCKDVITQIKAHKYNTKKGIYCSFMGELEVGELKPQLCDINVPKCNVCAIGATFLSLVRLKNEFKLGEVETATCTIGSGVMFEKLQDIWSYSELRLIEHVFEGWIPSPFNGMLDPDEKLIKMMETLIKNNGDTNSLRGDKV